jgi:hypothetical protein
MIASFTGTRKGMTPEQREAFRDLLRTQGVETLVHGDCVGADEDADRIASTLGVARNIRPCNVRDMRARCDLRGARPVEGERPPLERNRDVVNDGACLIACPSGFKEERRSGTWATVRYARSIHRDLYIIWPDGRAEHG